MEPMEEQILSKLRSVFTLEQLQLVADSMLAARVDAMDRRCNQSVEVLFNDKGYPRFISIRDTVPFPVPGKGYSPE